MMSTDEEVLDAQREEAYHKEVAVVPSMTTLIAE
jgi:hypothetical protein